MVIHFNVVDIKISMIAEIITILDSNLLDRFVNRFAWGAHWRIQLYAADGRKAQKALDS